MDSQYLVFWLEAFLCVWLSHAATENFVVSVNANVFVHTKETAVLPCWLSPQQTAEDMEVTWFHLDQFDAPVMLYKDKAISSAPQPAYKGRVSFGQKHASSAGLKEGDVTLKLVNVTLADAGKYTCYVSSDKHHDRASFNLLVSQIGLTPLLTAVVKENNKLNVSCESEGWYPKPHLQWSNDKGALKPKDLFYRNTSSGLLSVHSWMTVDSSSALSCSVGLPGEEAVQGRIHVTPISQIQEGSFTGWVLFAITAVALVAVLGFLLLKKYRGKGKPASTEEMEKLLSKDPFSLPDTAMANYENIQLEGSGNEFIIIRGNKLRDAGVAFPDGKKVTCITAVRGTRGFTSGEHYWEVSLTINGNSGVPPKKSWWIGVTSHSEIPSDLSPTTENGFWFLSSSPDQEGVVKYNANICVSSEPQKIGVLLDYDDGKLAFYNVQNKRLIGYFQTTFSGPVFPLFNPGKGDSAPMEIIHRDQNDLDGNHIGTSKVNIVDENVPR